LLTRVLNMEALNLSLNEIPPGEVLKRLLGRDKKIRGAKRKDFIDRRNQLIFYIGCFTSLKEAELRTLTVSQTVEILRGLGKSNNEKVRMQVIGEVIPLFKAFIQDYGLAGENFMFPSDHGKREHLTRVAFWRVLSSSFRDISSDLHGGFYLLKLLSRDMLGNATRAWFILWALSYADIGDPIKMFETSRDARSAYQIQQIDLGL